MASAIAGCGTSKSLDIGMAVRQDVRYREAVECGDGLVQLAVVEIVTGSLVNQRCADAERPSAPRWL